MSQRMKYLLFIPIIILFFTGFSKCAPDSAYIKFQHKRHVEERGIGCESCHPSTVQAEPQRAKEQFCASCHEIDRNRPSEKCLLCHEQPDYSVPAKVRAPSFQDVIFSHKRHLDAGVECLSCHGGKRDLISRDIVPMEKCTECHRKVSKAMTDCSVCHKKLKKDVKPSSHDIRWLKLHGMESKAERTRCDLCHRENSCVNCHKDRKPRDHGEFWYRKGHGLQARYERERCAACHTEDTCIACHTQVRPADHTAAWTPPVNAHCRNCHLPIETSRCVVCHKVIPAIPAHR